MGDDDPFDYALALELGVALRDVRAMPNDEYVRWRAYMSWRSVQRQHQADVANMRARYR